jgi:predicted RNase H-like nuclease (RuvC/YqgF family)
MNKWRNAMDIQKELQDKFTRIQDINKQLAEINQKIGALQEEGRAIHAKGLELKGALDMLMELDAKEKEAHKNSKTAGLILPEGVKPVVADSQEQAPVASVPELPVEAVPGPEAAHSAEVK